MKKITILLAVLLISACAFAQKATEIQVSKLPKATTDYISDNLPGAKITKASKVEDKGVLTYSVDIDVKGHKHVLIFDKDGKFLKALRLQNPRKRLPPILNRRNQKNNAKAAHPGSFFWSPNFCLTFTCLFIHRYATNKAKIHLLIKGHQ
jgi:hypothetical protein